MAVPCSQGLGVDIESVGADQLETPAGDSIWRPDGR